MIRVGLSLVLILILYSKVQAQDFLSWKMHDRYFSVQLGSGTTTYFGDLKHDNHIRRKLSNAQLGVEARLWNKVGLRFQGGFYEIKGTDAKAADSSFARQRNLSFFSSNWEANLQGVFYLNKYSNVYYKRHQYEPYLTAGIGATYFNPKADFQGRNYELVLFSTEGVSYRRITMVVPIGAGVKMKLNRFMNFNLEASYHWCYSDRIDDVSKKFSPSYPNSFFESIANRKGEVGVINEQAYQSLVPGGARGDHTRGDGYLMLTFQLEFYLPAAHNYPSGGRR